MKVTLTETECTVTREPGDKPFRNGGWGSDESALLYAVKRALQRHGHTVIKKRMWRDGHMVDELQQYIRTPKFLTSDSREDFAILDNEWCIRNAAERFNTDGAVTFTVIRGNAV